MSRMLPSPPPSEPVVHVVWLHDPDDTAHYWERDWLCFLLSGLPAKHHHCVTTDSPPLDGALVIFGNDIARPEVRAYLHSYRAARRRHGLIHLSDEYARHDTSSYAGAAIVFRAYHRPESAQNTFALGYKQGFWDSYAGPSPDAISVRDRRLLWAFAGNIDKPGRSEMFRAFRALEPHVVHRTAYWNSPDCLSAAGYRDLLLDSVFAPSPKGTYSLDCFRTYEALEAGCIPIVLRETAAQPFNYYEKMFAAMGFAEPVPFPQVTDWKQGAALVKRARRDLESIEQMRLDCHAWWTRYKLHTRACFTERVRAAFAMDAP